MDRRCEMTVELDKFFNTTCACNKPAKYITPLGIFGEKQKYVCGIHKNSVDAMYKRLEKSDRCKLINNS